LGNQTGGHRGKSQLKRGALDVKFNTYKGALLLSLFFTNWKSGRRSIRVKHLYLLTLELNWEISTPGILVSKLADYLIFCYLSCSRKGMALLYIKTVLLY